MILLQIYQPEKTGSILLHLKSEAEKSSIMDIDIQVADYDSFVVYSDKINSNFITKFNIYLHKHKYGDMSEVGDDLFNDAEFLSDIIDEEINSELDIIDSIRRDYNVL